MRGRVLFAFKHSLHSMAAALGLRRLRDYLQGSTILSGRPLWLLGARYGDAASAAAGALPPDVADAVLADFASRLWMSYRSDFPPVGPAGLTSDVGWGCTLRSGQMLLAQALLHHSLGRDWRAESANPFPLLLERVVRMFWDHPGDEHPLSVHGLVAWGGRHGVAAGRWLGPWALCNVIAEAVNGSRPMGLRAMLVSDPGGGAPFINRERLGEFCALFEGDQGAFCPNEEREEWPKTKRDMAVRVVESKAGTKADSPGVRRLQSSGGTGDWCLSDGREDGDVSSGPPGLVVLVALMLGARAVHPAYLPQLKEVMTWPQSLGIVGGRPASSLYFVGFQEEHVIYLDPHEVQPIAPSPGDPSTYQCRVLRHMPIAAIDPSLAIGFYCRNPEELEDLVRRLGELEARHRGAPLVTITSHEPRGSGDMGVVEFELEGEAERDDWEMVS